MVDERHAQVVSELRARIAHLEQGRRARRLAGLRLGVPAIDSHLPDVKLTRFGGAFLAFAGGLPDASHPRSLLA